MRTLIPEAPGGTSDLQITRVGFGAWGIDGSGWSFSWSPEDDCDSIAAVRHSLDLGVDWIDTTVAQGLGDHGAADPSLSDMAPRDRPYVFTKCGLILEEGPRTVERRHSQWPASIRSECESSLRRLGVERVDLYQLDWPDRIDERADHPPRTRTPAFGIHRTGVMWYSPRHVDILAESLKRAPATASAVAVAWTLTPPGVAAAIVGARSAEQIESWIDAVTLVLARANLGEIVTAIGRTSSGHGAQLPAPLAA